LPIQDAAGVAVGSAFLPVPQRETGASDPAGDRIVAQSPPSTTTTSGTIPIRRRLANPRSSPAAAACEGSPDPSSREGIELTWTGHRKEDRVSPDFERLLVEHDMARMPVFSILILLALHSGCASTDETTKRAMKYQVEPNEPTVVHGSQAISNYSN
jgi:hypothetical protein